MTTLSEDDLIARFFAPLATAPGAAGLTDDAAVLPNVAGDLVVTKDLLVAGVHFFPDDPPDAIARKALRVNLSDLAAKGARPLGFLLGLGLPAGDHTAWLTRFAEGLGADAHDFGCPLYGGDTVKTNVITLSITAFGEAPRGKTVRRASAMPGDVIVVTGTIGDAALGLKLRAGLTDRAKTPGFAKALSLSHRASLIERYLRPEPRVALADAIAAHAHAAMDVSDGFAGDLAKLLMASNLAGDVEVARVPLSPAAQAALGADPALMTTILTGGDDYEILATVPAASVDALIAAGKAQGLAVTPVGRVSEGAGLKVVDASGREMALGAGRYQHF